MMVRSRTGRAASAGIVSANTGWYRTCEGPRKRPFRVSWPRKVDLRGSFRGAHSLITSRAAWRPFRGLRAIQDPLVRILILRKLDSPAELFVQGDEREAERVDGVGVGDDVVAGRQHLQLVARHGRLRQPLEDRRLDPHQPERDVQARAARSLRVLQPRPELVPGDGVGAADLEGPVRRLRLL